MVVVAGLTLAPALLWTGLWLAGWAPAPGAPQAAPYDLSDRLADLRVETTEAGPALRFPDGSEMTAEEFLADLDRRKRARGRNLWFRVLDITSWTSVFWVLLGLMGQVLFTGRMLVQWLASERARTSVVPEAFWWMSLFGASMLIVYFIWRIDIVGVLGQATGWFVYVRNLWFIRRRPSPPP